MMTKPPGFASSSTLPLDDEEESIDESLDEILLEANERPPENSVKSLEAVPSALESDDDSDAESAPSAPGEVTVLAPRPTFFDEVREEETKVDPYETAIRAAASRDDGLTSQASQQRDRALRKSTSQPSLPTLRAHDESDVEFEDADASDDSQQYGASLSGNIGERTPADIPIVDDDASPPSGFLSGSGSGGFQPRLPPPMRTAPPPGRPDIYPGRRIPTPNTTSNTADFLPVPSGGFGSGSHYPSIAIPAPVAPDNSGRSAALSDNRIRLPAAGLAGFLVTAFAGGLLIGALLWRGHAAPQPIQQLPVAAHTAPAIITEPVQPIVKPVPPAPAPEIKPVAPAATAAAPSAGPSMPTLAAEAPPPTAAAIEPPPAPKPTKKSSSASRPRKFSVADEDAILNGQDPTPPPPPRPAKRKKAVWQDPFAQ